MVSVCFTSFVFFVFIIVMFAHAAKPPPHGQHVVTFGLPLAAQELSLAAVIFLVRSVYSGGATQSLGEKRRFRFSRGADSGGEAWTLGRKADSVQ